MFVLAVYGRRPIGVYSARSLAVLLGAFLSPHITGNKTSGAAAAVSVNHPEYGPMQLKKRCGEVNTYRALFLHGKQGVPRRLNARVLFFPPARGIYEPTFKHPKRVFPC